MRETDQKPDYYEILGVTKAASAGEIRRAYRCLARNWHPKVNPSSEADRSMQLINEAWEVLGDDEKRAEYDRTSIDRKRSKIPWRTESYENEPLCWTLTKPLFWIFIVGPLILWVIASGYSVGTMIEDVKALHNWLNPQPDRDIAAVARPTASYPTPSGFVGFGPKSGSLDHDSSAGHSFDSEINVRDFLATIEITNPESTVGDLWMRGLMVRAKISTAGVVGDFVGIDSNGTWRLIEYGGTDLAPIAQGISTAINTKPGEQNSIQVMAVGAKGRLSVNGEAVAEFNFPGPTRSGSIIVFSAAEKGTSLASFSGFTVRGFTGEEQSPTESIRTPISAPTRNPPTKATQARTIDPIKSPETVPVPPSSGSSESLHNVLARYPASPTEVKALIDRGAPLETLNANGRKPIEVAAAYGQSVEVLRVLIDAGVQVQDASEVLHLILSSFRATPAEVKLLIGAGASVETLNVDGQKPIEIALRNRKSAEILRVLIDAGARVQDVPDALHSILANSRVTPMQVELLIDAGAPLETRDAFGRTPVEVAEHYDVSPSIKQMIVDAIER